MNFISEPNVRRRALLAATLAAGFFVSNRALALSSHSHAAIKTVANFDVATWHRLLREGPRPAAYVFTTTYCSTCPDVFDQLHAVIAASGKAVELAAVVMDAQGERAIAHARHYQGATRLYAFNGFEPEIRQAVDPKWRNITPYVVLVGRSGTVQRTIGAPDAAMLRTWLA